MEKILQAKVEITYKNPLTNLDEAYTMELPVPIKYKYIAKTLNWSLILLILLIILLLSRVFRRSQVKPIHKKKKNAHHLENEIDILEQARASMLSKKKVSKPKSVPEKKEVKSTVPVNTKKVTPKASPVKKAPPKKDSTKKATEIAPVVKPTPPPVAKKTPVKKPRAKAPPTTEV